MKKTKLHDFVMKLPEGLDTIIGDRGANYPEERGPYNTDINRVGTAKWNSSHKSGK
jgi:hypothetical protein